MTLFSGGRKAGVGRNGGKQTQKKVFQKPKVKILRSIRKYFL